MVLPDQELYDLLLKDEYLTEDQLKSALANSKAQQISFYDCLVKQDLISNENLGKLVADYYQVPFIDLSKVPINETVLKIIPEELAQKEHIIAYDLRNNVLSVATSNPTNQELLNLLGRKTGAQVKISFATDHDLVETYSLYKKELQSTFDELIKQQSGPNGVIQGDAPVGKIVDTLIEYAFDNKASDIHIEPMEAESLVRFRIDGVLHDVLKLPHQLHEQVVTRIKVESRLRTDEHYSAQDGKMQVKLDKEELDIRVSIVPIVDGEKCVLRLLSSHFRTYGLTDLGMNEADLEKVRTGFTKPYGMILSTGPTGSGKTTSMYAILKILNIRERNIATIEDPVEYDIDGINQIQVNPKTNLTFAEGLRSILRQDPDIIYVGEIRDEETADIAINSAMTGHLVLSTLHTNDAATSLPRLIDMGIEPFLVASTVNVIIAQRLVRKICEKCRVSYMAKAEDITAQFREDLVKKHLGSEGEIRLYHGKGCPVCHQTGYVGRVGIFEVLVITEALRDLITKKADSDVMTKKAIEEGMTTMLEDGLAKVQEGMTTLEEILRVTAE